jgi:diguanylate cyclase (GGDEF)-like protein/PAS domain S-box-containing protein
VSGLGAGEKIKMNAVTAISGSYDYRLVAVSVVLAMFASYAALDLSGRVTSTQGRLRVVWQGCGAAAMGLGIWSMHYVGMLAFALPMPVFYDFPTVMLSLAAAVAASAVALFVVSRPEMSLGQGIAGSVVMGAGIAAMHYIGMAAMRCGAAIEYDRRIVALSIVLAIGISMLALQLAFRLRDEQKTTWRKIIGALVLGSAIPLTHYTGMWAAGFRAPGKAPVLTHAIGISTIGVVSVSVGSLIVLAAAIVSSFFDRFVGLRRDDLDTARERELYFNTMAEAIPEIIWTADSSGGDDFFNRKCFDYTGMTFEQLQGAGWTSLVHPDDLPICDENWRRSLRTGEPYEVQYRLRGKDGTYRWLLCRANPIRDSKGKIVKWFGICTDIEDQKKNQQILEQQILERTMQLADINTRLQNEMSEKDSARHALDQQNANMMAELERRTQRATMLAKMGELLQSCVSREEVISAALGYAPKIFPAVPGALALLDASRSVAEVTGSWNSCRLPAMAFEMLSCWALRTGHPHLVVAGDFTARCEHAAGIRNTYLCTPILAQGETLGIVHFQTTDEVPELDASEISFKTTFAGQIGLSIANIRLREALRTQSVRDALTGLYNRRYLEEVLAREVRRAARADQSLGILMIDLDHFKSFNDTYGHDAGDAVLRETGTLLTNGIRAEDFVFRFGGEEFVVVLPTADLDSSSARAERLRLQMKELTLLHQGRSMGMLTISVGVAAFPAHGSSPKELMAVADAALYNAKHNGRDQIVIAPLKGDEDAAAVVQGAEKSLADWK